MVLHAEHLVERPSIVWMSRVNDDTLNPRHLYRPAVFAGVLDGRQLGVHVRSSSLCSFESALRRHILVPQNAEHVFERRQARCFDVRFSLGRGLVGSAGPTSTSTLAGLRATSQPLLLHCYFCEHIFRVRILLTVMYFPCTDNP